MPRIFDNIEKQLLPALRETLVLSQNADFCVGYFNLRGWKQIDTYIESWLGGKGHCCRILVGMQRLPQDELKDAISLLNKGSELDNQTALRLKRKLAEDFRRQLSIGAPSNDDESGLRRLARQIRDKKVIVKLFLRYPLHAKLYLLFRPDPINPTIGYLGSSNLTFAGLSKQGELNIDVLDEDACRKLALWFEDKWKDRWCIDISEELAAIIETSWAREDLVPPHHIYIKMAWHLSREAREGLSEFKIPRDFGNELLEFQTAAVKIAAHHLHKRGGVMIGDVVGLGKTLMGTALARVFEDDLDIETLILCPKNLVPMWEDYRDRYRMRAKVVSISQVINVLPSLRRYRLVLIDESHNLRNREGARYRAIQEYIHENESRCILLSATPYNKAYLDLASQLRLIVPEDKDLGIRPERLMSELGDIEFSRRHQCPPRSLAAFEKSEYADDWRELMRLYMVRRTRGFIQENYAGTDEDNGRKFLTFADGSRSYFPSRVPKTLKFKINDANPDDQYARLYSTEVVDTINGLSLPRYGLGNYIAPTPDQPPTTADDKILKDLSRAGKRLMGFCRTNLFKRLESGGQTFMLSIERHILRNYIYLHAIENNLPLPIGTQDAGMLDTRLSDDEEEAGMEFENESQGGAAPPIPTGLSSSEDFKRRATEIYSSYCNQFRTRYKWLRASLFIPLLKEHLTKDSVSLIGIIQRSGSWLPEKDAKLQSLHRLLTKKHPDEKIIIFTQFADTVNYLAGELKKLNVDSLAGVTGDSPDPTALAWRFSPESNRKRQQIAPEYELRVIVATDVLSEGQNLQDCSIVVNYDLPWAIIRLIQRAGRVDRIGQKAEKIICYSFLPADGVEHIIHLRDRVRQRLQENAEVVGTDEAFFEDERNDQVFRDLFTEKSGILDGDDDNEVDLTSYAYQIWKRATDADPSLKKTIEELPDVIFATKPHTPKPGSPEGVLTYIRTADGNDSLIWVDMDSRSVTESQYTIIKMAECTPDTPALPRLNEHHDLVCKGVEMIVEEEKSVGGQLGRPSGARFRTYERLKKYAQEVKGTLFESQELLRAIDEIYRSPLRSAATDTLNRQLRSGIDDATLAQLVITLHQEDRLCVRQEEGEETQEPRIICSMGLKAATGNNA